MTAIILSIGDELILGQNVDTNSAWLSRQLTDAGCPVLSHLTVPDDQPAIERAIAWAADQCDWLIVTGGLGPTADDLTRQAIAGVLGQPLEIDTAWLARLGDFFRQRRRPMPAANAIQAMIPRGAWLIDNLAGTAAGIDAILPGPRRCRIFAMPGVPKEMFAMFQASCVELIRASAAGNAILTRTLHTFGLGESAVAEMLGPLMDRTRNPSVGTTVSGGIVSLRIAARSITSPSPGIPGEGKKAAQAALDETIRACRKALGDLIYGEETDSLQSVVGRLLAESGSSVSTAESCTGGWLAKLITDVPGSSGYFQRGWVTYSNQAKTELLDVEPYLIARHGAVSEPIAAVMAQSARGRAGSTYSLAISGIAGPDGGTPEKPVGTVCIAVAHPAGIAARTFNFPGDREMIRERSAKMALALLRYRMLGVTPPF